MGPRDDEREPDRAVSERGLTDAEAERRMSERPPPSQSSGSRSYGRIVRANVPTVFNLILAVFGTVTLIYGDWRDALFLGILVANTAIGIVQKVRAKRALDRLSALVAPVATVVRDGRPRSLHVDEVVAGDLVRLAPGDQVIADGRLVEAEGLALDESILSGESEPLHRGAGEEVPVWIVRARGAGGVRRGRAGRSQLRGTDRRRGACLPPSAFAARARIQSPAARPRP
jgi:magnesium-transporting ATPase (P-type)